MIRTTMCEDTVLSLLQSQLTNYLMVEKYGNSDSLFGRQNRLIEYFDHLDSEEFDQEIKEDQEEE